MWSSLVIKSITTRASSLECRSGAAHGSHHIPKLREEVKVVALDVILPMSDFLTLFRLGFQKTSRLTYTSFVAQCGCRARPTLSAPKQSKRTGSRLRSRSQSVHSYIATQKLLGWLPFERGPSPVCTTILIVALELLHASPASTCSHHQSTLHTLAHASHQSLSSRDALGRISTSHNGSRSRSAEAGPELDQARYIAARMIRSHSSPICVYCMFRDGSRRGRTHLLFDGPSKSCFRDRVCDRVAC